MTVEPFAAAWYRVQAADNRTARDGANRAAEDYRLGQERETRAAQHYDALARFHDDVAARLEAQEMTTDATF